MANQNRPGIAKMLAQPRVWAWTTPTVFFLIGFTVILWPVVAKSIPGDLGDPRFNLVMLEYFWRCVRELFQGKHADFLNAPFLYPYPRVTNFADTFWGQGEPYLLARAIGQDPFAAFRIWFVAGFVLNFFSANFCIKRFGIGALGSASGAFLFTFGLPILHQIGHAQLFYRFWIPPAVLMTHRFWEKKYAPAAAAAALFCALQIFTNLYTGLFCSLLIVAHSASTIVLRKQENSYLKSKFAIPTHRELLICVPILAATIAVLMIVAIPYLKVEEVYGFTRPWEAVRDGLPKLGSYFLADRNFLWPDLTGLIQVPQLGEQFLFPGIAAVIPLCWFSASKQARARRPLAGVLLASIIIVFLLTLNADGLSLYRILYLLPGFGALRSACRVILALLFPLGVLLGLFIEDLLSKKDFSLGRVTFVCAIIIVMLTEAGTATGFGGTDIAIVRQRDSAFAAKLPMHLPEKAILAVAMPPRESEAKSETLWQSPAIDAQYYVVTHPGVSTIDAYTANLPNGWVEPLSCDQISQDLKLGRDLFMSQATSPPIVRPEQMVLIGFDKCDLNKILNDPALAPGKLYHFQYDADGTAFLGAGFYGPESWGRWSKGTDSFLLFSVAEALTGKFVLQIKATTLSFEKDDFRKIGVSVNGTWCGNLEYSIAHAVSDVTCPARILSKFQNTIHFSIGTPIKPATRYKHGSDNRDLGFGIETLQMIQKSDQN